MDAVVIVVTGIWVLTTVYAMVNPHYAPPSMVQIAMSAVLAAVLGNKAIRISQGKDK